MHSKKPLIAVALIVVLAVVGVLVHRAALAKETPTYRFATVEKGDLRSTVSATGTLSAVNTVTVGTQVSGQVSELHADFNDEVKKGELLARIDPTLARQAVTDAEANLQKVQAQALQARRDYARNRELSASGLIAKSELEQTESSTDVAAATVKSARVALDRARQNLSYTNIYAPIDGVVVERKVDIGQTVAASLSAPELFLIANDLTHMQILAQVGEADIAQIQEGQPVQFTVAALTGQTFKGTVQQVRLQSATTENVVNYTVVVSVENPEKKLLPGMTARVEFLVKTASAVLKVPNAALRFKPADDADVVKTDTTASTGTGGRTSTANGGGANAGGANGTPTAEQRAQWMQRRQQGGGGAGRTRSGGMGTIYTLNEKGQLVPVRVRTGITDGTYTEVRGRNLKEGMKIVAGASQKNTPATASTSTGSNNPFGGGQQPQGQRRGAGGPGGF
ncbi:MAG: efflux RND transporter periplasmic adaptor subunit [Acidobacteria bacterium]|nr:efflux RND transporter periplasmic adaptor subunit [Acidobacteriota bacterium]MBV9475930.1 efflux RND transporter periplasmic adaptor subunit [Acidobacteriota bacterium]